MWLSGPAKVAEGLPLQLIEGRDCVVGRDRGCQLRVHDLSVSRKHATLRVLVGDVLEVEDLNSSNGTFVNGERVGKTTLRTGDHLTLGVVEFVVCGSPLHASESSDAGVTTARIRRQDVPEDLEGKLTATQLRVFNLLLAGLDENQIAAQFNTRPRTVHNHIQAVYRALKVHSRQQLLTKYLGTV